MKVLLLGADGQLGSDVVSTCPSGVELMQWTQKDVDVTDLNLLRTKLKEIQPETVINACGYTNVDHCETEQTECFQVNTFSVQAMAEELKQWDGQLVHISTDFVFDGERSEGAYSESDSPNPVSSYGMSKYVSELFCEMN